MLKKHSIKQESILASLSCALGEALDDKCVGGKEWGNEGGRLPVSFPIKTVCFLKFSQSHMQKIGDNWNKIHIIKALWMVWRKLLEIQQSVHKSTLLLILSSSWERYLLEFQDLVGTIQWFSVLQLFEFEFRGCLINAVPFTTGTQIEIWTGLVEPMQHTRYGLCVKIISVFGC